jgi:hypothetical protein
MSSTLQKKDNLILTDVLQSRKNLRGSHRNMIDGVDDLGLLHLIAEQTIDRQKTVEKGSKGGSPKKGSKGFDVAEETRVLIASLRATEKRVIAKMELSQDAILKVGRLYVKFRGPNGLDKKALQHVLQRKQKAAFSAERFEDLWRTLQPDGLDKNAVSFTDLLAWAGQYLPFDFADGGEDVEVSVEKRRQQARERERQRIEEEAAANRNRVISHTRESLLPAVRRDSPDNSRSSREHGASRAASREKL